MNVYDFDGTIYEDDSTVDFYFYLLKKRPVVLKYLPSFLLAVSKYKLKMIDKTKMKETFYRFLNCFKGGELDLLVADFWSKYEVKIYDWYVNQKKPDDVIISASPRYLLEPICKKLRVSNLICSEVDKLNGDYHGLNCYGIEKVSRFFKAFPNGKIDKFYSDSKSDTPLAKCAKEAFLVKKPGVLIPWKI